MFRAHKNRPLRPRFRPGVEGLENRTVPAGNVTASVTDGVLYVVGDNAANQFAVTGIGVAGATLTPLDATTTINGQAGSQTLGGISRGYNINGGGGDNVINLNRLVAEHTIIVNTGAGNDIVRIFGVLSHKGAILNVGEGNDQVSVEQSLIAKLLSVTTGGGDDTLSLTRDAFDNILLNGGGGVNTYSSTANVINGGLGGVFFNQGTVPTTPTTPTPPTAVAPTVTVSSSATERTSANPIPFTVTFSEDVSGFDASDIALTSGTITGFTAVDGRTFNFGVVPGGQGSVSASVVANAAVNAAGTGNTGSNVVTRTFDTVSPTVAITPLTTTDNTPTLTGTVSENAMVVVVVNNQTVTATVSGTTWSATIPTALANGVYRVVVTAVDGAGNSGSATNDTGLTINGAGPSANITSTLTSPTNAATIPIAINFASNVNGFDASDITVSNGSVGSFVATNGQSYTAVVTPTNNGTVTVNVAAGAAQDSLNNPTGAGTFSITSDRLAPSLAISSTTSSPTTSTAIPLTFQFSEPVTGFTAADVVVQNGSITTFASSNGGQTYTATLVPNAAGAITVDVAAGAGQDAATNASTAAPTFTITFNPTLVTTTITSSRTNPTNATTIPITIQFSQAVTGFEASDISVTNGTLGGFTQVNGQTYNATITQFAQGTVTVNVPAGVALASNNPNSAGSFSIVSDTTAPTATITSTLSSPTTATTIPINIVFSEDVTTFVEDDIVVTNGALSNFVQSDDHTYSATLTPSGPGEVTASIPAGATQDAAGNVNPVANFSIVAQTPTGPTLQITSSKTSPTNATTIPLTFLFSQDVTGFDQADITTGNGTLSGFTIVDGRTYTATLAPINPGAINVNVAAGVAQGASGPTNAASFSIVFDNSAPSLTITSSEPNPSNAAVIPVTFQFSEDVSGFDVNDIAVNGSVSSFAKTDDHTYTANITPSADGLVTVSVGNGAAQDSAGNASTSGTFSITSDRAAPSIEISAGVNSPSNAAVIPITITFSEDVTAMPESAVIVGNGALSNFSQSSARTYLANITPTADGAVTVNIAAGVVTGQGSPNTAGSFSITSDRTPPTATITSPESSPTNEPSVPITIVFNEDTSLLTQGALTVTNGALSNFTVVNARTYQATLTPTNLGLVTVDLAANAATDAAGNNNPAATFSITFTSP
jgi:hypothetical protein